MRNKLMMRSKVSALFLILFWAVLFGGMSTAAFLFAPTAVQAAPLSGCTIRVESNATTYTDLQSALNAATGGDLLKVAGICVGTSTVNGLNQAGYITRSVTIQGGYTTTNWLASDPIAYPSVIDADWNGRGLVISPTTPIRVVVDSLTLQSGYVDGYGGGLFITNTAVVTLHQTILQWHESYWDGNNMDGFGGAIYNASHLTVTHSAIIQNYASDSGGAIYGAAGSHTYLHNSTIAANESGGGAINSEGTLAVSFSTIIGNEGGGVLAGEVANSIIVHNQNFGSPANCDFVNTTSTGHNVLGPDCTAEPTDVTFAGNVFAELLEPLADNGGPTPTHALYPNSTAVDLANAADCPAIDQRGESRVASVCDAGAFELIVFVTKLVSNIAPGVGDVVTYTLLVNNPLGVPLTAGVLSDTLPVGVALAGSVSLEPLSAGTAGTFPEIVTAISLASGERLTVTFPVTVTAAGGSMVTNTAVFTATNLPQTQTAQAIFKVSNCFARPDSNGVVYGRLQGAIDAATSGDTVRVAGVCDLVETMSGTPQVGYIAQNLTLRGGYTETNWVTSDPIANPTVIDGVDSGRGLRINGNVSVLVENLSITNGNASGLGGAQFGSDGGAAILNTDANLTLNNVALFNNQILAGTSQEARGGALASDGGDVMINNSAIHNNLVSGSFSYGGGVMAANGVLTINESEIYGNTAVADSSDGSPQAEGGGIYVASNNTSLHISNSRIASNSAEGSGGGIAAGSNVALTIMGSEVASNIAQRRGGGLYLPRVTAVISQSHIHSNVVNGSMSLAYGRQGGGGLYIESGSNVTIRQTLVANNRINMRGLGGGIAVNCWRCTNTITLENSTLSGNTAVEGGGGFSSYIEQDFIGGTNSTILLNHVSIINNNATSGTGHAVNQERNTAAPADVSRVTASFSYQNSLIAGNGGANECGNSATHGTVAQLSGGYNLFIAGAGCTENGTTDQTVANQATLFADVVANALAANRTHPLVNSLSNPAFDAIADGVNGCDGGVSIDQRGAVRADGPARGDAGCDVGAYELSLETPTAVSLSSFSTTTSPPMLMALGMALLLLLLTSGCWVVRKG